MNSIEKSRQNLSIEIFVVDNNSTDGSIDYLEPLFANVKFIKLDKNLGFARANNIAINQSNGKYLLILNPDTVLAEDTLEKMYDYMNSNLNVGIAGCKVLNADGTFQLACRRGFPTPWASFCKLFGLQNLFPHSKLFAQYNQTFRSENETYKIDAVIGAFMFCDTKLIQEIGGFDEKYFMYGEDLDLCRQVQLKGRDVMYYHEVSVIHFKGESTRRSSINEVKYMYESMAIFAKKYFSNSTTFLLFLQFGIISRSIIAYISKYNYELFLIIFDLLAINFSLLVGSFFKFGEFFGFADYAYPLVFIVISSIYFSVQVLNGEYFEGRASVGKTVFSLMICFFILSSFTYFFPDYRFSRGALLITVGLTAVLSSSLRIGISIFEKIFGKQSGKRIIVAGSAEKISKMIDSIQNLDLNHLNVIGVVTTEITNTYAQNFNILGNINNINSIVEKNKIDEVIITDPKFSYISLIKLMGVHNHKVRFHIIPEYDELVTSRIINDISGVEPVLQKYNIGKLRLRITKRIADIFSSIFMLTLGLPLILFSSERLQKLKNWIKVLIGTYSTIGIYPLDNYKPDYGKIGIISLALISNPKNMGNSSIVKLNNYYLTNYSFWLDIDIFIKYFFKNNLQ